MNEKLTAEQIVEIIRKYGDALPSGGFHLSSVYFEAVAKEITTNTAEDEKERSLRKIREVCGEINTTEDECICNLDPDDTCPVKIFNEDCPIHGYEYEEVDGWVICPDCGREIHLPFPDENQIALGKLVEGVHEHGLTWTKELLVIKDWLQQEDK